MTRTLRWRTMQDAGALLIPALIALFDLRKLDRAWDTVSYHLPFSALRAGIVSASEFTLRPDLRERFLGFPSFADTLQGLLWRLFANPAATELLAPIAVTAFAIYARLAFGQPAIWSVAIFLAVPTLHTALDSSNVDLWTNAAFAIHLLALFKIHQGRTAMPWSHFAVALVALGVAANSKPQFYVLGALSFAGLGGATALAAMAGRPRARLMLAIVLTLSPLLFYAPLKNAVVYGNPVYPSRVRVLGTQLNGAETNSWTMPAKLAGLPAAARYVLSQLDLDAANRRPGGFTVSQGEVPDGTDGDRMGGSLSVLLLGSLACLVVELCRVRLGRQHVAPLLVCGVGVAVVANFPGGSELRYFSFVNILVTFSALAVLRTRALVGDAYIAGLYSGLRIFLASGVVFTSFLTGLAHVLPINTQTMERVVQRSGLRGPLALALRQSSVVCYARPGPDAFLVDYRFNTALSATPYRVVNVAAAELCPAGSGIIR